MTSRVRSVSTTYKDNLKKVLKQHAFELVRRHSPNGPPYDPLLVAEGMCVEVKLAELDGIEGYIESHDGKHVAVISTRGRETRRRFTLAHELCHVLLTRKAENETVSLFRFRANGNLPGLHQDPVEESLCDYFAAELLMPSDEVQARLLDCKLEPRTIFDLASDYNVSTQAAAIQVVRLLKNSVVSCSFWNLESLWPVPVWWAGYKKQTEADLRRLEQLVDKRIDLIDAWQAYGGEKDRSESWLLQHLLDDIR